MVSAKHGQSPQNPAALTRIPDTSIITAINAAWAATHPNTPNLVVFSVDDDGMLLWTSDRSAAATGFVKTYLLTHTATGNDINGNPVTMIPASGLTQVYAGEGVADLIGVSAMDPRLPDVIGIARYGTVYTGGQGKIAEHGGDNPQDRNVPILVSGPSTPRGRMSTSPVETTQVGRPSSICSASTPTSCKRCNRKGPQFCLACRLGASA